MSSFDTVNYSVRPNKNVERKLIVQILQALTPAFDIPNYAYIGMGSLWFSDFVLLHKALGIRRMISIEHKESADRVEFNRPYSCISIARGDVTTVLPSLNFDNPATVWLDYDTGLEGPALKDMELLMQRCAPGSVIMVTANAHIGRIPRKDAEGNDWTALEGLKSLAGDLVSPTLSATDVTKPKLPDRIGEILFSQLKRTILRAGRAERFTPIFHYHYNDNAPMVTVGGMVTNDDAEKKLGECSLDKKFPHATGEIPYTIDIPVLTFREKVALDRLFPCAAPLSVAQAKHVLGFDMDQRKLDAYHGYYQLYPVFGEMPF